MAVVLHEDSSSIVTLQISASRVANIIRVNNQEFEFPSSIEAAEAFADFKEKVKNDQPWEYGRFFVTPDGITVEWASNVVYYNGKPLYFETEREAKQYFDSLKNGLKNRYSSANNSGEGTGSEAGAGSGGGSGAEGGISTGGGNIIIETRKPTPDDVYNTGTLWVVRDLGTIYTLIDTKQCENQTKAVWIGCNGELIDILGVNICDLLKDGSCKGLFTFDDTFQDKCSNFHLQDSGNNFVDGKWGKAVYVTSSKYLEFTPPSVIVGGQALGEFLATNSWTISFWVKAASLPQSTGNVKSHTILAGKDDFYFGITYYHTDTYNEQCDFRIGIGDGNNWNYWLYVGENHSLIGENWDKWNHWAVVKDGSTIRVYLNGQKVKEDNSAPDIVQYNPYRIGIWGGGYNSGSKFYLDQMRLFNRPLNDEEILKVYREEYC